MKRIFNIIKNFLKHIHRFISTFLYLQYIIVSNPKYAYEIIQLRYINKIKKFNFRSILYVINIKELNFRSIFKLFKFKYLIIIWIIFLYFNALFGAGIIVFYTPLNDILNSFLNFIHFYHDNIFIIKFKKLLHWFKNILDYLSNWLDNILNNNINSKVDSDVNSIYKLPEVEFKSEKLNSFNSETEDYKNLRKEYNQTFNNDYIKNDNYNWLKYTLIISGVILVIGGISYYYWDTIISYYTSKSNNNTGSTSTDNTNLIDLSDNNNSKSSEITSPESIFDIFFKSPDSSQNTSPSSSIPSSPTSSTSSTITLRSKPEEILINPKLVLPTDP
jgi:hypothetical protein